MNRSKGRPKPARGSATAPPPAGIRVAIADDHGVVRESLAALVREQPDMQLAGTAPDGQALLDLLTCSQVDVVVMDVSMPVLGGVEATRLAKQRYPELRVIGLSVHTECARVTSMLEAGAVGYVLKQAAGSELIEAIRRVARGEIYVAPSLARDCLLQKESESGQLLASLTARERVVLGLLAEGIPATEVARRLKLSYKTVATHREHIMAKLGVHTVSALTRLAIRGGLSPLDA